MKIKINNFLDKIINMEMKMIDHLEKDINQMANKKCSNCNHGRGSHDFINKKCCKKDCFCKEFLKI
jgi:hypothetical protein